MPAFSLSSNLIYKHSFSILLRISFSKFNSNTNVNLNFLQVKCLSQVANSNVNKNSSSNVSTTTTSIPHYLQSSNETALRMIASSLRVIESFVTEDEEENIMKEIEPYLKRMRYEERHWDDAIRKYRETERLVWNKDNEKVIERIRNVAFPVGVNQIKHVHILDLHEDGLIKPHIDSVRFCGDTITGLSLLSSSVMRLVEENNPDMSVDVLLKRNSLYIMTGDSRYKFTHAILDKQNSIFKNELVKRARRVSVICRNEPNSEHIQDDDSHSQK